MRDDVEGLLKKYRPAGPPHAFEDRLLESLDRRVLAERAPRTWPWAAAVAALLAITIGLHVLSMSGPTPADDVPDAGRVQTLTEMIGGPNARVMAEYIVRQEQRADADAERARAAALPREVSR